MSAVLAQLARARSDYGPGAADRKLAWLASLARATLRTAAEVETLHETLCFLAAYPDDARVRARTRAMLDAFARRSDLRRHRAKLADSGIAGTDIRYRFFQPMADWLARRWPQALAIDWKEFENQPRLEGWLPRLAPFAAGPALDEVDLPVRAWIDRMKGAGETDAAFLIRAFARLEMDDFARETLYDEIDVPMTLRPMAGTPSRTVARFSGARVVAQRGPLMRTRPDLHAELRRPPLSIRPVAGRRAHELVDLARAAMVTRQRDLDVFAHGDPRDVRLVDAGDGLQFACIGAVPERRLLLESVYGFLSLKNGVPIGYVLVGALFGSAEVAYNVFETYRGAEAGVVYGRVLAMARALFGADTFMIPPYQLGEGNDEAIESGAWWFYRKLGFAPRDAEARRLVRVEEARLRGTPAHRSSASVLKRLGRANVYFHLGAARDDVLGLLPLPHVGVHVMREVAERFGGDAEKARAVTAAEAARRLSIGSWPRIPRTERMAVERWGPLVAILPGLERWSRTELRAAGDVIRAKGGRRESDFAVAFDRHARLRAAVRALAERDPGI